MSVNFVLDRAAQYLSVFKDTIEQNCIDIDNILYQEGREAAGEWREFVKGSYWGKNDTWYQFCTEFVIPDEYE